MREAFLDYLVLQDLVDPERLEAFRCAPAGATDPIGRLALQHGMITGGDVDRILRHQGEEPRLFGEIACELEVLTPEQLARLLDVQELRREYEIVEALVLADVLEAGTAWVAFGLFLLEGGVPLRAQPENDAA